MDGKPPKPPLILRIRRKLPRRLATRFDRWEEPEILINEALREMRLKQIRNRERAVAILTRKHYLACLVSQENEAIRALTRQIREAREAANEEAVRALEQAMEQHIALRDTLLSDYEKAKQIAAHVRTQIYQEEALFRKRTARALAAKTLYQATLCELALADIRAAVRREYGDQIDTESKEKVDADDQTER